MNGFGPGKTGYIPYAWPPPMGAAYWLGGLSWRVLGEGEIVAASSVAPLAKVVPLDYDGFDWRFPEAPAVSR
jgi:hypothetical protein